MAYKLKPVPCWNCIFYKENAHSIGEGVCDKDGEYTRDYRVCDKLPTNEDRRNAKIILNI